MKKKSIMKFCAIALTVAMMGTLVACGGGDTPADDSSSSTGTGTEAPADSTGTETPADETTPADDAAPADDATDDQAAAPEETYDFGGQVVKVYGGDWNKLNPDSTDDNTLALDAAAAVEAKYNIDLVYNNPGDDGYNLADLLISSYNAGESAVDICAGTPDGLISLIGSKVIADITDSYQELEVGSVYTDAVSWKGHVYGLTFDNIGDVYVLAYSRDYLDQIGMEVTPTEKFMNGEWSYDDVIEYFTEMKSKLPEGVYPIGTHYFHWACMAGAANGGVPAVSSDGVIGITDEHYIEAMEFYKELMDLGLAAPITFEHDDAGTITNDNVPYGSGGLNTQYVMTMLEAWQLSGLTDSIGQFGITFWPWGDSVTCDGDYTTLSDNYKLAQAYWGPSFVMADAAQRTGIDNITLLKIAMDYFGGLDPNRTTKMHAVWEAEQAGETPVIGFNAGAARDFCTEEDIALYDWAHTRVIYEWAKPFDDGGVLNVWMNAAYIMDGQDARSTAESYASEGLAKMQEMGIVD